MLLHTVLFWVKPDAPASQVADFERGLKALIAPGTGESLQLAFVGRPAATREPVIDHSYAYKLVVGFPDRASHDRYQVSAAHQAFIARHRAIWSKVTVYDADQI